MSAAIALLQQQLEALTADFAMPELKAGVDVADLPSTPIVADHERDAAAAAMRALEWDPEVAEQRGERVLTGRPHALKPLPPVPRRISVVRTTARAHADARRASARGDDGVQTEKFTYGFAFFSDETMLSLFGPTRAPAIGRPEERKQMAMEQKLRDLTAPKMTHAENQILVAQLELAGVFDRVEDGLNEAQVAAAMRLDPYASASAKGARSDSLSALVRQRVAAAEADAEAARQAAIRVRNAMRLGRAQKAASNPFEHLGRFRRTMRESRDAPADKKGGAAVAAAAGRKPAPGGAATQAAAGAARAASLETGESAAEARAESDDERADASARARGGNGRWGDDDDDDDEASLASEATLGAAAINAANAAAAAAALIERKSALEWGLEAASAARRRARIASPRTPLPPLTPARADDEEAARAALVAQARLVLPHLPAHSLARRELLNMFPRALGPVSRPSSRLSSRASSRAGLESAGSDVSEPIEWLRSPRPAELRARLLSQTTAAAAGRAPQTQRRAAAAAAARPAATHADAGAEPPPTAASMRAAYVRACEAQPVSTLPVSRVLNSVEASALSLRSYTLGPSGGAALAALLALNTSWRALDLAGTAVGSAGARALAGALRARSPLESIDLSGCGLGGSGAKALGAALATAALPRLATLRLRQNELGDDDADELAAQLLAARRELATLDVGVNRLGARGARALGQLLEAGLLAALDLGWNALGAEGARELHAALARAADGGHGAALRELELEWNGLGERGGLHTADALIAAAGLRRLGLGRNGLGEAAACALASAMRAHACLGSLELSHNPLGQRGLEALLGALDDCAPLHSIGLEAVALRLGAPAPPTDAAAARAAGAAAARAAAAGARPPPPPPLSTSGALLDFDRTRPAGSYALDLAHPWERWIATQLRELALSGRGARWRRATLDADGGRGAPARRGAAAARSADAGRPGATLPRPGATPLQPSATSPQPCKPSVGGRRAIPSADGPRPIALCVAWELPRAGILRVDVELAAERPTSLVHYALELAEPRQRAIARVLLARARAEPGENWLNERLDGARFQLDEADLSWSLPEAGLLELDYATFRLRYEETYALDLARAPERAILSKLVERAAVERSNERFVDATLDALPIRLPDSAASAARWTMPPTGLLRASFVSATPQHVSTKHYALDLAVRDEWRLAERLRQWAVSEPGENFLNETLDGFPFTFNESDAAAAAGGGGSVGPQIDVRYSLLARAAGPGLRAREKRRNLPKAGLLEFDYVTLRPRTTIAVESRTFRLDLSRPEDVRIARTLRSLGADMGGKNWVDESVDGHALRVIEEDPSWQLPARGLLELNFQTTLEYDPPKQASEREMTMLLQAMRRSGMHSERDVLELLHAGVGALALSAAQVARLVGELEALGGAATARRALALALFDKCTDPQHFDEVARAGGGGAALIAEVTERLRLRQSEHITTWEASASGAEPPHAPFRHANSIAAEQLAVSSELARRRMTADEHAAAEAAVPPEARAAAWHEKHKTAEYAVYLPDEDPDIVAAGLTLDDRLAAGSASYY